MPLNDDKGYPVTPEFVCVYVGANTGIRCTEAPVYGAPYCARHSGKPDGKTAKTRHRLAGELSGTAVKLAERAGVDVVDILKNVQRVDPGVLLLEEVARCAAVVKWLEDRIAGMTEEELMHEPDALAVRERKLATSPGGESYKVRRTESRTTVSRYWKLLQEERKALVLATTAALRSNIEERRVRLAERGLNVLEAAVAGMLIELGLDPHNDRVRATVGKHLRQALEAGEGEPGGLFLGAGAVDGEVAEAVAVHAERETVAAPPPPPADF